MSEHTPGPWTLKELHGEVYTDHGSDWLFGPDGKPIIHFHPGDYDSEAWYEFEDANARLIAAAPELLAALESCIGHIEETNKWHPEDHPINDCPVLNNARAVIARAKGETE